MQQFENSLILMNLKDLGALLKYWEDRLDRCTTEQGKGIADWMIHQITREILFKEVVSDGLEMIREEEDAQFIQKLKDLGIIIGKISSSNN